MNIVEKIKYLAKLKDTDMSNIEKALGMGNSSIRRWNTNSPSCDKVLKVANYLSVSIDWLIRDELEIDDLYNPKLANLPLSNELNYLLKNASKTDLNKIQNFLEISTIQPNKSNLYSRNNKEIVSTSIFKEHTPIYGNHSIPVRGYVAAGIPIEAIDNDLDTIEIPTNIDADYALIVNGNSMYPLIKDGDYVFVKSCKELNNGDIGVFYYNGSVTCKKYFKNDSILKLISINPAFEDFTFSLKDQKNKFINFNIEGKVILSESQKNNQ